MVSLSKGQTISLEKRGGGTLTRVRMGLGWDAIKKKGMFGKLKDQSVDLDASALLFDGNRQLVDQVWFQQLRSKDGSVQHTGDNLTGAGEGDDESIVVDLQSVPATINQIVFVVNSFTGQNRPAGLTTPQFSSAGAPPARPRRKQ
jgi:tellurium resistance protein TerZ